MNKHTGIHTCIILQIVHVTYNIYLFRGEDGDKSEDGGEGEGYLGSERDAQDEGYSRERSLVRVGAWERGRG